MNFLKSVFLLPMVILSCSTIRLPEFKSITKSDWYIDGGINERVNIAKTSVEPPCSVIWTYDIAGEFSSSVSVATDTFLFLNTIDGKIYIFSLISGKPIGSVNLGGVIHNAPILNDKQIYIAFTNGRYNLIAYDLEKGSILWRVKINDGVSSFLIIGERIYVTTTSTKLICLNKEQGKILWTFTVQKSSRERVLPTAPASDGNILIFGTERGLVYAIDINNQTMRWRAQTLGSIIAAPSIRNGNVYVCSLDSTIYSFSIENGDVLWKKNLSSKLYTAPAICEKYLYITTAKREVFCLDNKSGKVIWKTNTAGIVTASPILSGKTLYLGDLNHNLYAFDAFSGVLKWQYKFMGQIKTKPLIHRDYLLVFSSDQKIIAFKSAIKTLQDSPVQSEER